MKRVVRLGQYLCDIDSNFADEYIAALFSGFETKTHEAVSRRVIHLRNIDVLDCVPMGIGWQHSFVGNMHRVMYSENYVVMFALEYCNPSDEVWAYVRTKNISHIKLALQFCLLLSLSDCAVGLHGVTMICNNQAIVLSAPSGTGKTTLARLLKDSTKSIVINGDFALLAIDENNNVVFEPTPFCGTSGCSLNYRLRISRVVFLEQAKQNSWKELDGREKLIRLLSNAFVPEWDCQLRALIQNRLIDIGASIPCSVFSFEPTTQAAEVFYQRLICEAESFISK